MRIIGGSARRTPLSAPDRPLMRPTTDRVRESLFSILAGRLPGSAWLDLFAGSGAVGLEALSRGADRVVAVEEDRRALDAIRSNAARARLQEGLRVVAGDVFRVLDRVEDRFDVIYADPPYDSDAGSRLLQYPRLAALCAPGGVLVLESRAGDGVPTPASWETIETRTYGRTDLHFLQEAAPGNGKASDS